MFSRREEYKKRLPKILQPFITWLTGIPHEGQRPLFKSTPWLEVFFTIAWFSIGLLLAATGADLISTSSLIA